VCVSDGTDAVVPYVSVSDGTDAVVPYVSVSDGTKLLWVSSHVAFGEKNRNFNVPKKEHKCKLCNRNC
jgi:hypothetical protein